MLKKAVKENNRNDIEVSSTAIFDMGGESAEQALLCTTLILVNSGHCEEQSDVAILWLINVL